MTPNDMKPKSYQKTVGLDGEGAEAFVVECHPNPSYAHSKKGDQMIQMTEEASILQQIDDDATCMDHCFSTTHCQLIGDSIPVHIPSPSEIVILSPLPGDTPTPVIYPPPARREKVSGNLDIPIITIRYVMEDVPKNTPVSAIVAGLVDAKRNFEGNCCFRFLVKAFRSHRNRLTTGSADLNTVSWAMCKVEEGYGNPDRILMTPSAYAAVRPKIFHNPENRLLGARTMCFEPKGRGDKRRSFVLDEKRCGVLSRSEWDVDRNAIGTDSFDIVFTTRLALVITNRDVIACIACIDD